MTTAISTPTPGEPAPAWRMPRPVNLLDNSFSDNGRNCRPAIRASEGLAVYRARIDEHRRTGDIKALKPVAIRARNFSHACVVCGGWDMDTGLNDLLRLHIGRNDQGHLFGFPEELDVYILGDDEQAAVPLRPSVHPFNFGFEQDAAELLLTPTAVYFNDDHTRVRFAIEEAC